MTELDRPAGAEGWIVAIGEAARRGAWWAAGAGTGATLSLVAAVSLAAVAPGAAAIGGLTWASLGTIALACAAAAFVAGASPVPDIPGEQAGGVACIIAAPASCAGFAAFVGFGAVLRGQTPLEGVRDVLDAVARLRQDLSVLGLLFAVVLGAVALTSARVSAARGAPLLLATLLGGAAPGVVGLAIAGGGAAARTTALLPLATTIVLAGLLAPGGALLAERRVRPWLSPPPE